MKHFILFFYLVTQIAAYSLYGGYERMYFYYAYLIDRDLNNGQATKIARGCKSCSFNEFIAYINKIPTPNITPDAMPDVDRTAQLLENAGLNGIYDEDRIYQGTRGNIPSLFKQVASFIQGNLGQITDPNTVQKLKALRNSVVRFQFLRMYMNSVEMKGALEGKGITVQTSNKFVNGQTYEFVDVAATKRSNPGVNVQAEIANFNDESHLANIKAATITRARVCGGPEPS